MEPQTQQPTEQSVTDFWAFARDHVGWTTLEGIFGQQQASTMTPPWMHLSANQDEATALAQALIDKGTYVFEETLEIYPEDGDLPKRGDLVIVVDGTGRPAALAATLDVSVSDANQDAGAAGAAPAKLVRETLRCLYPTKR